MADPLLHLDVQPDDGMVVIRCQGELDLAVTNELARAIQRACTPGLARLRIDASELRFIDSSGLSCLLRAREECDAVGATFDVLPSPAVERLFKLTSLEELAAIPDKDSAATNFLGCEVSTVVMRHGRVCDECGARLGAEVLGDAVRVTRVLFPDGGSGMYVECRHVLGAGRAGACWRDRRGPRDRAALAGGAIGITVCHGPRGAVPSAVRAD